MFKFSKKARPKKRKGSAILIIIVIMIFATAATALMLDLMSHNRRQAVTQAEDVQLYYLTKVGLDSVVEALTNDRGNIKVSDYTSSDPGFHPQTIEYKDNIGNKVGECNITVKRITKMVSGIYEPWIEVKAKTTMKDSLDSSKDYEKIGVVLISVKNPLVREYEIRIN